MTKIFTIAVEAILVLVAILAAHYLENHISFIPSSIISLPKVDYSTNDLLVTSTYFLTVHVICFSAFSTIFGVWKTTSAKRTAEELFCLALAFSISTIAQFLTSNANFDTNLIIGIFLINLLLFVLIFTIASFRKNGLITSYLVLLRQLLCRSISPVGILILLLTVSPAILAKLFISDRDFANRVTQWRMYFAGADKANYSLVSALGDLRFQQPMLIKSPGDLRDLYILERSGKIYRLSGFDDTQPELILDISSQVGYVEMENGALGMAFHPKFDSAANEHTYLYLYYTSVHGGKQVNRVSRFDLSGTESDLAKTELPLITLDRESSGFHNGGSLEFGPDGFLYIALGEGIRTPRYSSLRETFRMGILRIDVDQNGGEVSYPITRQPKNGRTENYYIPSDNPFIERSDILAEYWAVGLRNPYRVAFDPVTGDLWAGDVGSTKWEEVNLLKSGHNYQFPYIEGFEETGKRKAEPFVGIENPPIYTYFHTATDRAVIGGVVYRGSHYPKLDGMYLFGDNYSGKVSSLPIDIEDPQPGLIAKVEQYAQRGISSITQLSDGHVYVTTLGRAGDPTGKILRLVVGQVADASVDAAPKLDLSTADIREIYTTNCSRCHGVTGQGDGPDQALLNVPIADFTSPEFKQRSSKPVVLQIIRDGGPGAGLSPMMPPWKNVLDEQEMEALGEYILSLAPTHNTLNIR